MGQPIVHWEIGAKDAEKLQEFYAKLFDWQISPSGYPGYMQVDTGQENLAGGIMQIKEDIPPYVAIYVSVDDLQTYLDKAESMGGKTVVPPTPIPTLGSFAVFLDPEEHPIGLFQRE